MTTPYLYLRSRKERNNSGLTAFREVNGQLTQIGDEFGTAFISTNVNMVQENMICHWGNKLYAHGLDNIWEWDIEAGGPWQAGLALPNRTAVVNATDQRIGFTPCSIDGSGVLCTAYVNTTSAQDITIVKIDLDGNYSITPTVDLNVNLNSSSQQQLTSPGSYRNSFYFLNHTSSYILFEYNLKEDTFTQTPSTSSNGKPTACVFRDKIFHTRYHSTTRYLYRKDGSTSTLIWSSGVSGLTPLANSYEELIPYGDSLIYFTFAPFGGTLPLSQPFVFKLDFADGATDNPTVTEITNEIWGGGQDGIWNEELLLSGTAGRNARFYVQMDITDGGPTNPTYRLTMTREETLGSNPIQGEDESQLIFSWVPPTGALKLISAGGMDSYGFDYKKGVQGNAGFHTFAGSGTIGVSAPQLELAADNSSVECTFKVYGPNVSDVALQTVYSPDGTYTLEEAMISSTTVGSLSGNIVTGITATTAGTEVVVVWEAVADGVTLSDNPNLAARVFTT